MADFPAITPTVRAGNMGTYATKKFTHIAGNATVRIYNRYPNMIPLIVEDGGEAGITDEQAADIYQCWLDSGGDRLPLTLSAEMLSGMSAELLAKIPTAMSFYFNETPPVFTDTIPGRKRVRLTVEARFAARHVA